MPDYKYLFRPLPIGNIVLKNRVIWGPHVTNHWPNQVADERTVAYYEERAAGGVGMITIGGSPVDPTASNKPLVQPALWDDACIPGLDNIAQAVHRYGTKLSIQLHHPGVHHLPDYDPEHNPPVAPSQIPAIEAPFCIPKALEVDEILAIQDKFAAAAERMQKAGLDGVEIHGSHGYLFTSFLTPLKNKRTDRYGGSLENRARFSLELLDKIRRRVGKDFVVGSRISTSDLIEGGLEPEDVAEVVKLMYATGHLDYINCSAGLYRTGHLMMPTHYAGLEPGYQADLTAQIKSAVPGLPVFMVGRINDPLLADRLIADGSADACVLIRELIAEPEFVNKAEQGRTDDIRPCAYWNPGCVAHIFKGTRIECQMNAAVGRELEFGKKRLRPAPTPRHVLVVGGGPGGLEFARIAVALGHRVSLHERDPELGGQCKLFARLPGRAEVRNWVDWLARQVDGHGSVDINLGSEINAETIDDILAATGVDEIVIASGARAAADGRSSFTTEPIPGYDRAQVLTYEDLLGGILPETVGARVLVVDELSDRIAPGLAEMLAGAGREVEIVTRWPSVGHKFLAGWLEMPVVYARLDSLGVKRTPNTWISGIGEGSAAVFNIYSGRCREIETDTVILVTMKYSNNGILELVRARASVPVHTIGDVVAPRQIADAVRDATELAHSL